MGLIIQYGKSKWWYGRLTINGRYTNQNLGVEIRGRVPENLRELGDTAFELSRQKAQAAFDKFKAQLEEKQTSVEILQRIHKIRTGKRAGTLLVDDAFAAWESLPRRKAPSQRYVDQVKSVFARFSDFLKAEYKQVTELADVQPDAAVEFMAKEAARGVSPKTYNNTLIFLRSCCEALRRRAGMASNPFEGIPTKEEDTVHRKPFTAQELQAIVDQAKKDKFIGPIIITGICTAMRRGDCCLLKWDSVDLKDRFIAVKTSKTGELVRIPILPLLTDFLKSAETERKSDAKYVFPEQAVMYQTNPDGISLRAKNLYAKAGFHDLEDGEAPSLGKVSQKRSKGLRRASVRDFQSLRVTWVTLALSAGVPIEIVQKVTGHRTAQIVMKHYFQPGKEDYRRTIEGKLPALMGGTNQKELMSREKLRERLQEMNGKNWKAVREELLGRL